MEKQIFVTKLDLTNVKQILPITQYLHDNGVIITGSNLKCPKCGANASVKTGAFKCFGCGIYGDVVDIHKEFNNFSNIYEALRDLMSIYNIQTSSKGAISLGVINKLNKDKEFKAKALESLKNINIRISHEIIINPETPTDILDGAVDRAFMLDEVIAELENKTTFTDKEKSDLRAIYKDVASYIKNNEKYDKI